MIELGAAFLCDPFKLSGVDQSFTFSLCPYIPWIELRFWSELSLEITLFDILDF